MKKEEKMTRPRSWNRKAVLNRETLCAEYFDTILSKYSSLPAAIWVDNASVMRKRKKGERRETARKNRNGIYRRMEKAEGTLSWVRHLLSEGAHASHFLIFPPFSVNNPEANTIRYKKVFPSDTTQELITPCRFFMHGKEEKWKLNQLHSC